MRKEERERLAEEWLNAAIQNLNAEPRLGLETRILANLSAQERRPRAFLVRSWQLVAVAAVIALLASGVVLRQRGKHTNVATSRHGNAVVANLPAPTSQGVAAPSPNRAEVEKPKASPGLWNERKGFVARAAKRVEVPRREQFPTPAPLSNDERLLLGYLRSTPPEEVVLVAHLQAEQINSLRSDVATESK